jgi:hypothetical protein
MSFEGLLGALRRRWYVILVGLLMTAGAGWAAYSIVPSEYHARGLILLLPSVPADEPGGNPFLGLGNLDLPARVLVASYSSNAAQQDIAQRAPDAKVVVSIEESTRGPVIAVDVTDTSASGTLDTLAYVSASIPQTLATLQSEVGVPLSAVVRSMPLTTDTEAERKIDGLVRVLIAIGVGGIAVSVAVAYALDGVMSRRVRRRPGRGEGAEFDASEQTEPVEAEPRAVLQSNLPAQPVSAASTARGDQRRPGR